MLICSFFEGNRNLKLFFDGDEFMVSENGKILIDTESPIDAWEVFVRRVDMPVRKRIIKKLKEGQDG